MQGCVCQLWLPACCWLGLPRTAPRQCIEQDARRTGSARGGQVLWQLSRAHVRARMQGLLDEDNGAVFASMVGGGKVSHVYDFEVMAPPPPGARRRPALAFSASLRLRGDRLSCSRRRCHSFRR